MVLIIFCPPVLIHIYSEKGGHGVEICVCSVCVHVCMCVFQCIFWLHLQWGWLRTLALCNQLSQELDSLPFHPGSHLFSASFISYDCQKKAARKIQPWALLIKACILAGIFPRKTIGSFYLSGEPIIGFYSFMGSVQGWDLSGWSLNSFSYRIVGIVSVYKTFSLQRAPSSSHSG